MFCFHIFTVVLAKTGLWHNIIEKEMNVSSKQAESGNCK